MYSAVGACTPYTVKHQRVELVSGYFYRFIQCSFPCGILMLALSLILMIIGSGQLLFIYYFDGCTTKGLPNDENLIDEQTSTINSIFKCNRHTIKVLGITSIILGLVLFVISLLITTYSRSTEENNIIRTTTRSLSNNNNNSMISPEHDQNHIIVSMR